VKFWEVGEFFMFVFTLGGLSKDRGFVRYYILALAFTIRPDD